MIFAWLAAVLASPAAPAPEGTTRSVTIAVVTKDSSAAMSAVYRSELALAAIAFWKSLPPDSRTAVWTCGTAPSKVVDFGADPAAAETKLQMVAPGGNNLVLDAIVDAARELRRSPNERRVLVVVTNVDLEASRALISRALEEVGLARATPMIVLVQEGPAPRQAWDAQTLFEQMAGGYGGSYDHLLAVTAVAKTMLRTAADLRSQYEVHYESGPAENPRLQVKVTRKDCRVRVGRSRADP